MSYQFRKGFAHKVSADVAGAVCEDLAKSGSLTPKKLVEVSRPKNAPLHSEFEWNNTRAADLWRQQQARMIINSLVVVAPETQTVVRKFYNIQSSERSYETLETIMSDVNKRELLLKSALQELDSFKRKYADLEELAGVFNAIDDLNQAI